MSFRVLHKDLINEIGEVFGSNLFAVAIETTRLLGFRCVGHHRVRRVNEERESLLSRGNICLA